MSRPRRSIAIAIRLEAVRRQASSSVSATSAQARDRGARRGEPDAGVEAALVVGRDARAVLVDEVGERVGEAELGGPDRALRRGAEQPRLRRLRPAGQRLREPRERVVGRQRVLEVGEQLGELVGEVVRRGLAAVALERVGRHRVGARGAAEPEVDPAGVQAGQQAEASPPPSAGCSAAASRRRCRRGSAASRRRAGRSAPRAPGRRASARRGARRPSSGDSRGRRPAARGRSSSPARRGPSIRPRSATGRARSSASGAR